MPNGGSDTSAAFSNNNPEFTASREQFSTNFQFAGHSIPHARMMEMDNGGLLLST